MLQLLSNAAQFTRFAKLVALLPLILKFVEKAEETGADGPEKRKMVVTACQKTAEELVRRGYAPEELLTRIDNECGEIADLAVSLYNTTRIFKTKKKGKREPGSEEEEKKVKP